MHANMRPPGDHQPSDGEVHSPRPRLRVRGDSAHDGQPEEQERNAQPKEYGLHCVHSDQVGELGGGGDGSVGGGGPDYRVHQKRRNGDDQGKHEYWQPSPPATTTGLCCCLDRHISASSLFSGNLRWVAAFSGILWEANEGINGKFVLRSRWAFVPYSCGPGGGTLEGTSQYFGLFAPSLQGMASSIH